MKALKLDFHRDHLPDQDQVLKQDSRLHHISVFECFTGARPRNPQTKPAGRIQQPQISRHAEGRNHRRQPVRYMISHAGCKQSESAAI